MGAFHSILFFIYFSSLCLFSTIYSLAGEPYHTTAFIGKAGELDVLFSYSNYSTKRFWNCRGHKLATYNHFHSYKGYCYSEYSLNGRNSLFFNSSYSRVKESLNGNSQGFEEFEIGWKRVLRGNSSSAFTSLVSLIIPPGNRKASIRYGRYGGQVAFLYAKKFDFMKRSGWYDLEAGYKSYQDYPSDQLRLSAALGYWLINSLRVILRCQLDYGLGNGRTGYRLNNIVNNPNYYLLKSDLECDFYLSSHFSIAIGIFKHLCGRNIGSGGGFFSGIWINF